MANSTTKQFKVSKNKLVLAYTAGIIDGEGYIGVDRQKAKGGTEGRRNDFYRLNVSVNVTDKSMTDFLMLHFGGYYRTRKRHTCNKKLVHAWHLDGQKAIAFLTAIKPFMVVKPEQAELAIEFRSSFNGGIYCKSGTPKSVVKFRHRCYERFKEIHGRTSTKPTPAIPLRLPSAV